MTEPSPVLLNLYKNPMPIDFQFFGEYRVIIERISGRVTSEELVAATQRIWASPDYDKHYAVLVDLRKAELAMTAAEVAAFNDFLLHSPDSSEGRVALLVSKPMETAFSFMFQSDLAPKNDIAVFSIIDSVLDFLQLPASFRSLLAV